MNKKPSEQRAAAPPAEDGLDELINETVLFFHRLKIVADEVHHQGETSGPLRGLLRSLDKLGAQTVPQMARARAVSRQHVQILVNQLAAAGHIEYVANPAHKRSPFVRLTPRGKKTVDAMNRHEARLLARADIGVSDKKMHEAAETLRIVRAFFESEQWQQLLKTQK